MPLMRVSTNDTLSMATSQIVTTTSPLHCKAYQIGMTLLTKSQKVFVFLLTGKQPVWSHEYLVGLTLPSDESPLSSTKQKRNPANLKPPIKFPCGVTPVVQ